jgi:hypothetical protein
MCACMHASSRMYVCMYVCMYVYTHDTHIGILLRLCLLNTRLTYACMCECMCVHLCVCIHSHVHDYMHACIGVHMCIVHIILCMYVCMPE